MLLLRPFVPLTKQPEVKPRKRSKLALAQVVKHLHNSNKQKQRTKLRNAKPPTDFKASPSLCGRTILVRTAPDAPAYIHCTDTGPFLGTTVSEPFNTSTTTAMATSTTTALLPMKTADVVNAELNLNLGQPWIHPERHWIVRKILLWANDWLVAWWEHHFYHAWRTIPLSWKQWLTKMAWRYYFALHRRLLHRKTAIHPDASLEYHAITTIFWWARFFPVSLQRMRFSLSQLSVWTLHPFQCRVEHIVAHETTIGISRDANSSTGRTNQHHHHYNSDKGFHSKPGNPHQVEGYWIHVAAQPTEYTLFWVFGGAFLAGDALGNLGPAEIYGKSANMDVFVPTHRLAPDVTMNEILWDVHLSYQWLVQQKSNPRKIVLLGISSGEV